MTDLRHDVFRDSPVPVAPAVARQGALLFLVLLVPVVTGSALSFGHLAAGLSGGLLTLAGLGAVYGLATSYPHDRLGQCNMVTGLRAGMASYLAGGMVAPDAVQALPWLVVGVACVAFALDGADGYLARRSDTTSTFGARFDMETDAMFAAVLSVLAVSTGVAGAWVLSLGFLRYGFVCATLFFPWLTAPLPERLRRKVVCVLQIAALIYLLVPGAPVAAAPAALALALVIWSFLLDIAWLARRA